MRPWLLLLLKTVTAATNATAAVQIGLSGSASNLPIPNSIPAVLNIDSEAGAPAAAPESPSGQNSGQDFEDDLPECEEEPVCVLWMEPPNFPTPAPFPTQDTSSGQDQNNTEDNTAYYAAGGAGAAGLAAAGVFFMKRGKSATAAFTDPFTTHTNMNPLYQGQVAFANPLYEGIEFDASLDDDDFDERDY